MFVAVLFQATLYVIVTLSKQRVQTGKRYGHRRQPIVDFRNIIMDYAAESRELST